MSGSFKKTQKPEPERPKDRSDSAKFIRENEDALDYPDVPTGESGYKIDGSVFDTDTLEAMEAARKAHEARKNK